MTVDLVQDWLKRTLRAEMAWNLAAAVGCFLSGAMVLFISFWIAYGVLWLLSHAFFRLPDPVLLLATSAFMALVIVVGARANLRDLGPLQRQVRLAKDMDVTLTPYTRYGMSYDTNAMTAGMFEIRSLASVTNFVLCGGVKLVFGAVSRLRQNRRLRSIEMSGCARVLALLHSSPGRQSFVEIVEQLPGLNPVKAFDDLGHVDGVLFLSKEPPGLTLLPELRSELSAVLAAARAPGAGESHEPCQ